MAKSEEKLTLDHLLLKIDLLHCNAQVLQSAIGLGLTQSYFDGYRQALEDVRVAILKEISGAAKDD